MMNILIAAAEAAPFAKTGGLADVVGALPKFLCRQGHEARLILPLHRIIREQWGDRMEHMDSFYVNLGWRRQYVGLERLVKDGITCYFIDNEFYFGDKIYRGGDAEGEQYSFFARAVADALPRLGFEPDVLHLNDWHTAVIALLLKTQYPAGRRLPKILLTIHNLAYQGRFSLGLACDLLNISDEAQVAPLGPLEFYGSADYLKAGCVYADRINTVSPHYAQEILGADFGEGLDGVLRSRGAAVSGILNGLDMEIYDPQTDPEVRIHYGISDRCAGKAANKADLQRELGLEEDAHSPLLAMVSRMTEQKGLDLLLPIADELINEGVQMVLLGNGEPRYEQALHELEYRHRGRCCSYMAFREDLGRRVYAGCDILLMPSRFEPCGLSQLIAMRYGALPLVHRVGGLVDTVRVYDEHAAAATGFGFNDYTPQALRGAVSQALSVYADSGLWQQLTDNAIHEVFGFAQAAERYAALYAAML